MRLSAEKNRLDRSLNTAEQELQEAQQQILMLQVTRSLHTAVSIVLTNQTPEKSPATNK